FFPSSSKWQPIKAVGWGLVLIVKIFRNYWQTRKFELRLDLSFEAFEKVNVLRTDSYENIRRRCYVYICVHLFVSRASPSGWKRGHHFPGEKIARSCDCRL